MKTAMQLLLLAFSTFLFAESIKLPLEKCKTERTESNTAVYEFPMTQTISSKSLRKEPITVPGKICFKVRTRQFSDRSKGSFWGIKLYFGKDHFFNVYSRGRGFEVILMKNNVKIFSGGSRRNTGFQFPNGEANPKWVDVEIKISKNATEFLINSKTECIVTRGSLPLQSVEPFSYFTSFEITEPYFVPDAPEKSMKYSKNPLFKLSFENTLDAVTVNGKTAPQTGTDLSFVDGVSGKGVRISTVGEDGKSRKRPHLIYDVDKVFQNEGTLSFWFSPDWNGKEIGDSGLPTYTILSATNDDNKEKLRFFMWNWIRFDLGRTGNLDMSMLRRNGRSFWFRDDFHHVVLVWKNNGWNKVYIDGIPFEQPWGPAGKFLSQLDLVSIKKLSVGRGPNWKVGEGVYDEIKVYNRQLSDDEIMAEYRNVMPVDLVLFKNHVVSGRKENLTLFVSPTGSTVVPKVGNTPSLKADIELDLKLKNRQDRTEILLGTKKLHVDREIRLDLPIPALPSGNWLLQADVRTSTGKIQRSFSVISAEEPVKRAAGDIRKGKMIFEKVFTKDNVKEFLATGPVTFIQKSFGNYAEAGKEKGDRFSFIVPIDKSVINKKPCLIEIEWPDDKARTMGLYMYVETAKRESMHRDRLGGGLLAGDEFPNSFSMQKISYLFYPGKANYLFEARTMVSGMPAAVSAVRIYELQDAKLPSLALNLPEGLQSRSFGFFDEDQSFNQNLNYDNREETKSPMLYKYTLDRLTEYMDYVGKNVFTNPFFRYLGRQYPSLSVMLVNAETSWNYTYQTEYLGRRGKKVFATLDIKTLPHIMMNEDKIEEFERSGKVLLKTNGTTCKLFMRPRPNPIHPEMRKELLGEIQRVAELYGKIPGFAGIYLWCESSMFSGLDSGYDDITISKFSKDTGIKVPFTEMVKRKEFLTSQEQIEKWLEWRAGEATALFRDMAESLKKQNPTSELVLIYNELNALLSQTLPEEMEKVPSDLIKKKGGKAAASLYVEYGLDLAAVNKIAGIRTAPIRIYNTSRHNLHWGKKRPADQETLYDASVTRQIVTPKGGSVAYPQYFETFTESLDNKRFNTYFQNVDLKPHGRFFLKELVHTIYASDAQSLLFGAQPFGSWGHEAETREFASAFRALPAKEFKTASGANDPAVIRYLNTPQGTWFYAVSMLNDDSEVRFKLSGKLNYTDLSDNKQFTGNRISLKAYQLRSFFTKDPTLKISDVTVVPSETAVRFYTEKVKHIQNVAALQTKANMISDTQKTTLSQMEILLKSGKYAALDTLLFSLPIRGILENMDNMEQIRQQAEMAARGHYAVNCGSSQFLKTQNGTLFAPDQPWNGKYGYFGSYDSVTREIRDVKDPNPGLFQNEAYNIDGYRFALPNGKYKVRLYMKIGFKRNAEARYYMFDVLANGKLIVKDFDIYTECNGDLDSTAIREYGPLIITNGRLELAFRNNQKRPWARLVNAIEIIREN